MNAVEDITAMATKLAEFPPLKLADRACAVASGSTQALVRVVKGTQDLLFDNHYFNLHQAQLLAEGWVVYEDIREEALNLPTAAY